MVLLNPVATAAPNIGDQGVVLRLRRSVYLFAIALALIAILQWRGAAWPFYLIALVPVSGAFSLAYQGLFKT